MKKAKKAKTKMMMMRIDTHLHSHPHPHTHAHPLSHRKMTVAEVDAGNGSQGEKKCKKTGLKMKTGANLCIINHSKQ